MATESHDHTNQKSEVVIPINLNDKLAKNIKKVKMSNLKNETDPNKNPDFATIKLVSHVVLFILKKCWIACSASIFIILMINWYYSGFIAFVLLLFSFSGLLYQLGDWLLFQPDQPATSRIFVPSPAMYGLPCENFFLRTRDNVKINVVFIKQDIVLYRTVPTILFFHGNAGNIGHRIANLLGLYQRCSCNILIIEYRGYGHSEGTPSEEGLYNDAQAGLDFLLSHPEINKNLIMIFGRSLGGAVAIDLASQPAYRNKVFALVVENTFTSIPQIARILFNLRLIYCLPECAYKNQFQSIKKISQVTVPTLFLSGQADTLVPPKMMNELYDKSGSVYKKIVPFPLGTHNETWQCQGYYSAWTSFISDVRAMHSMEGHKGSDTNTTFTEVSIPLHNLDK